MTLTEALRKLHAAGRIRSPWLSGMAWNVAWEDRKHVTRLPVRGRVPYDGPHDWSRPDLTDPATVGCLAALAREASGDATLHAQLGAVVGWCVYDRDGDMLFPNQPVHDTEGDAWAAVLVALAAELP